MARPRRSSFRRKLTVLSVVTSASTLLLAAFLFTANSVRNYRLTLAKQLATEADIIGFTVTPALVFGDEDAARDALAALRAEPQVTAARVFTPEGSVFATYEVADLPGDVPAAPPPASDGRFDYRKGSFELTHLIGGAEHPLGTLYLRADLTELKGRVVRNVEITGAVLVVSLLTAFGIASFLQREISTPILGLAETARAVTVDRNYGVRATTRGSDEIGVLVDAFNEMLDEIQRRDDRLRAANRTLGHRTEELARKNEDVEAFVYIVSHDLRAPLVNLQGFSRELQLSCDTLAQRLAGAPLPAETLAAVRDLTEVEIPSSLRFISASTSKFERLINALLQLSRSGRRELRPEALDMNDLVAATLDSLQRSIEESGAEIVVEPLPNALADSTAVGQLLSNLVTNALRYLQPGRPGRIELGGGSENGGNRYYVKDNGVGIPPAAQSRLFQVFQRFRPDLAEGEGIGLATVKRIVDRHGGRIWAESTEGVGTTFFFTLPALEAVAGDTR